MTFSLVSNKLSGIFLSRLLPSFIPLSILNDWWISTSSQISKKKFVRHFLFLFCFMFLNTNYLQTSFLSCMSVLFFNSPLPQIDKSSGFVTINNKQISCPTSLVIQIPTCFCVTTKAVLLRVFLLRCAEEVLIATDGVQILRICKQY